MPNMFGGDQHHPSYDPRTKLQRSEAMDGNTLCRVLDRVTVRYEEVDGTTRTGHVNNAPLHVQTLANQLFGST